MERFSRKNRSNAKARSRRLNIRPGELAKRSNLQAIAFDLRSVTVDADALLRPAFAKKAERFLRLPPYRIHAKWEEGTLRFGPSIAVYALPGKSSAFGAQTQLFKEMALLAKKQGIDLFVLTPGHLQYEQRQSFGYRYHSKQRKWRMEVCPWPDFVWRRTVYRPLRLQNLMDVDEKLLGQTSVVGTLPRDQSEKWILHVLLSQFPSMFPFLLPTLLVQTPHDLVNAVRQLGDVYLKPVRGTQGQQIVRIASLASGYVVQRAQGRLVHNAQGEILATDYDLQSRFGRLAVTSPFIAQRTVDMMRTIYDEPFDMRYLIQASIENGGNPICTGIVARVAQSEAITTNLHTGAVPFRLSELQDRIPPRLLPFFQQAVERGKQAALSAFSAVSTQHKELAELGVDIAFDRNGRVFVLEVNPCPGRQMFRRIDPQIRRLSLQRILEYAVFSTGFLRSVKGADPR